MGRNHSGDPDVRVAFNDDLVVYRAPDAHDLDRAVREAWAHDVQTAEFVQKMEGSSWRVYLDLGRFGEDGPLFVSITPLGVNLRVAPDFLWKRTSSAGKPLHITLWGECDKPYPAAFIAGYYNLTVKKWSCDPRKTGYLVCGEVRAIHDEFAAWSGLRPGGEGGAGMCHCKFVCAKT